MALFRALNRARWAAALSLLAASARAQPTGDARPVPPPPPPGPAAPLPPPPPPSTSTGYAAQPPSARQPGTPAPPPDEPPALGRPTAELWLGLGYGSAVCDDKKPDNDCPVDGAFTFMLGGGYRFSPHFAFGGELSTWSFHVRDSWQGALTDPATDTTFSSFYLAPELRWYWFERGSVDPYLLLGLGFGALSAHAENAAGATYDIKVTGVAIPLGIGAEAYVSDHFRLGAQALAYLQKSTKVCETKSSEGEVCRDSGKDENALPWRLIVAMSYVWGRE